MDAVVTLKLTPAEFDLVRESIEEAKTAARTAADAHRASKALGQARPLQEREARLALILDKLR